MNYEFSSNSAFSQFDADDTQGRVYIGFASEPRENVFSQKFRGSPYGSCIETLIDKQALLNLPEPESAIVVLHLVQGTVTLDVATTCFALTRSVQQLNTKQWENLSRYIGEVEKGFTRPPFLKSLYAFYYASAMYARNQFPGEEQGNERNGFLLEIFHGALCDALEKNVFEGYDSAYRFLDVAPDGLPVSVQQEILGHEVERFISQDYQRADYFELNLPLKHRDMGGRNRFSRVPMLVLDDPQSSMFKFFARNPMRYPGDSIDRSFPCTYVHNSGNRGRSSEHVISVPPTADYHLKDLSTLLEQIEDRSREQLGEPSRPKNEPRQGYDYNDPWYDERHSEISILDNPTDGSRLSRDDVLEALWFFGSPLKHVKSGHISTSFFVPFWPEDTGNFLTAELGNVTRWEPWRFDPAYLREFLPYMEKIFLETEGKDKRLMAFRYRDRPGLKLAPEHALAEGPAVGLVRENMLLRSQEILASADIELRTFVYEYGLGLLEIRVDIAHDDVSIYDSQWLEHCITLTPIDVLLGLNSGVNPPNPLSPHKHFACTSLTGFDYEGGCLGNGRSTGGGIQMMVSDVEPIFKNLPVNENLETHQTVIDEISKRFYYCSSTSLLNFDDAASRAEHELAHVASSAIFNMVLAQRFILSESRQDIVRAEQEDRDTRKSLSLGTWLRGLFWKDDGKRGVKISEVREKIQHMTTSGWFNVISNSDSIQRVFEKLREQMKIPHIYEEVQDRTKDLDEYIAKKQADVQSRVFGIFTFVMSPLNLVLGFVGGMGLATFGNYPNPVPFLDVQSDIAVFAIYFSLWSVLFGIVWMVYKYRSAKE